MIDFSINGVSIPGVDSHWRRLEKSRSPDGVVAYTDWAVNTWTMPLSTMSAFEALRLESGDIVSLTTNDIDDRDSETTYATAFLSAGLGAAQQAGINMTNTTAEFVVKVA